jgi:predicted amidohydrolase
MSHIVAGCCQFEVVTGAIDANLKRVGEMLPVFAAKGCRLLVLPEMWSCGFDYPVLPRMASETPVVLEHLTVWARQYQMVMVGSLPEAAEGTIFNTSYVVDATGRISGKYRKIHLFSLHHENEHFGRGAEPLVCATEAGLLGVMICYDIRFPELSRRLALDRAEILCVSALWPLSRIHHWSLLLRSRALENQCFVVGCNGSGKTADLQMGGASAVVSPTSMVLAEGIEQESQPVATLDMEEMVHFRKQIACFSDRREGIYNIY